MVLMNRRTGQDIDDYEHLRQSLEDILTTPLGSRVYNREYGSRLFELIDQPLNAATVSEIYQATAAAIDRWETRFRLTKINVFTSDVPNGAFGLELFGVYLPNGQAIRLDGLTVFRS